MNSPQVKAKQIDKSLRKLVELLVPVHEIEDEELAQDVLSDALEIARNCLNQPGAPIPVNDVHHASDLIKKDLIRNRPRADKALRFSNLYSRLLTFPDLKQKWAILYFLHQLADSDISAEQLAENVLSGVSSPPSQADSARRRLGNPRNSESPRPESSSRSRTSRDEEVFQDAFQPSGIPHLPSREGGQKNRVEEELTFAKSAAGQRDDVALKSGLLSKNYMEVDPPEAALLRDLPFTLQGLSSSHLPFSSLKTLKLPVTLPPPMISILHTLAEPSLLYRGLADFVDSPDAGLLGQSLRSAIGGELRSYLGLVATLEGQVRTALSSLDESLPRGGLGKAGVTLRRCVVWTREATMGLRLLSVIAEESKIDKHGGQLISLIHGFSSSHGDPMVGAFAERLLVNVTRPFYDMLRHWIYDGELSDPYHEFFVFEQDTKAIQAAQETRGRGGASSVWEDKYKINSKMIPSIITEDFAQKVFLIGKSLNFIRYGCGDSLWVEEYSKAASKELKYGDTETLETWIDEAYKTTMARLIHLMADKFHLFQHLQALKNYILLGQGDFIALLMESLSANLDRPAGAQYRHTLTAQLEHAIRGSNAQYDSPEVLKRLDARMLQLSHGDIGWDCFTLEYKISAPVDVVITDWGNRQYLKVFNFLWRIKRVEFVLQATWRKVMLGARGVLKEASDDELQAKCWKTTRGTVAEMIHFIGQLQYYILFEVIESSWDELQTSIRKEDCTLDDIISAHTKYLNAITHKGLLGAKRKVKGVDEASDPSFMSQLGEILRIMLSYRDAVDGLYSWSVAEFTRQQEASVRAETRLGRHGGHDSDEEFAPVPTPATTRRGPKHLDLDTHSGRSTPVHGQAPGLTGLFGNGNAEEEGGEKVFYALEERLKGLGNSFRQRLCVLLGDLAVQPDVDMRFLGVVMNFNDCYQPVRKSRGAAAKK